MNERKDTRDGLGGRGRSSGPRAEAENAQGLADPAADARIDFRGVPEDRETEAQEGLANPTHGLVEQVEEPGRLAPELAG